MDRLKVKTLQELMKLYANERPFIDEWVPNPEAQGDEDRLALLREEIHKFPEIEVIRVAFEQGDADLLPEILKGSKIDYALNGMPRADPRESPYYPVMAVLVSKSGGINHLVRVAVDMSDQMYGAHGMQFSGADIDESSISDAEKQLRLAESEVGRVEVFLNWWRTLPVGVQLLLAMALQWMSFGLAAEYLKEFDLLPGLSSERDDDDKR